MRTEDEIKFSQLHHGEKVLVSVHSQGCFHDGKKDYEFVGGEPPTVTLYRHNCDASHKIGVGSLSSQELEGVDALFRFYKELAPDLGGCTTVVTIHAEYVREGKTLGEEEYQDETCGAPERLKKLITRYHKLTPFGQETLLKKIRCYHVDVPDFDWIEKILTFGDLEQRILQT